MKTFLLAASLASTAALAQTPASAPPSPATPRELHAAQCVAALEVSAENLADQIKAGHEEWRSLFQTRVEAGTAFAGDSYLHGLTDETRARALANDALEAQKSLTEAQLTARQLACEAEGTKLLEASNAFERAVVKRLANRRMERLLRG